MQGILGLVETLVRDLRSAVRTLRRDAALTTFAILIIGVGVGASTTVFGVVNAQAQILTQTMTLAATGLAIGLPAAWMAAKAIQGLLFGVVSSDPVTFGGVVAVVAIVAGLAGSVPATRASRIDPVLALRSE